MIYFALDPGPLCGMALWNTDTNTFESYEIPYKEVPEAVRVSMPVGRLITEMFSISSRTLRGKVYYESLYINGWLDLTYGDELYWSMPAIAKAETEVPSKGGRSSRHLKALGWYLNTKNGHANDAAAHIMHFAKTDRNPWVLERLADL